LSDLPADLRFDFVGQKRSLTIFDEEHKRASLREACDPAFALAGDPIAVWGILIAEAQFALPSRFDRADFGDGDCLELDIRDLVKLLATGNAALQDRGDRSAFPRPFHVAREVGPPPTS